MYLMQFCFLFQGLSFLSVSFNWFDVTFTMSFSPLKKKSLMQSEMINNIEIILHFSRSFGFHSDKCFCFLPTHWRGTTKILLPICSEFNQHNLGSDKEFFFRGHFMEAICLNSVENQKLFTDIKTFP